MEEIIKELKQKARDSWDGEIGESRAENLESFLRNKLSHYENVLGYSQTEILKKLEMRRSYSAINFYQEANLPDLKDDVEIFETDEDFKNKYPSGKYICPSCKNISTNPQECSQNDCDWKSYGFLGTMGEGIRFVIKNTFLKNPVVYEIFKPIEAGGNDV